MRILALIVILSSSRSINAQEWLLVRPGWKYNYRASGSGAISDQVFITSTEALGIDTTRHHFNRIAIHCDTCSIPLRTEVPQFLQGSVTTYGNTWHFQDPASSVMMPLQELGGTWLMDTAANITAEVTAVDTLIFFGVEDVHKTISCSNGDVWFVSREWGIVRLNDRELVGVHGPDVGELIPTLQQMYPYQEGDVVEYQKQGIGGSFGSLMFRTYRSKYTILERTDQDSSIAFNTWRVEWRTTSMQQGSTGLPSYESGESMEHDYSTTAIELPYRDLLFSYPGELITTEHVIYDSPHLECVARHSIDEHGRYIFECDVLFGNTTSGSARYIEGIGLEDYVFGSSLSESYRWLGAVINGDTLGTVHSDDFLLNIEERGIRTMTAYPNPANETLVLEGLELGKATYVLRDGIGRIVLEETLTGPTATLNISRLPEGVYFVSDRERSRSVPARVMISR